MLYTSPVLTKYLQQVPLVPDRPHLSTKEAPSLPFSTSASPTRILLADRRVEPGATQIYCRLRPEFQISKSDKLQPIRLYT